MMVRCASKGEVHDTIEDMLRYVHLQPEDLISRYLDKIVRAELTSDERGAFLNELKQGLKRSLSDSVTSALVSRCGAALPVVRMPGVMPGDPGCRFSPALSCLERRGRKKFVACPDSGQTMRFCGILAQNHAISRIISRRRPMKSTCLPVLHWCCCPPALCRRGLRRRRTNAMQNSLFQETKRLANLPAMAV